MRGPYNTPFPSTLNVLLLSAAGIYAMLSFTVARRRREIGIRSALGADRRRILGGIFTPSSGIPKAPNGRFSAPLSWTRVLPLRTITTATCSAMGRTKADIARVLASTGRWGEARQLIAENAGGGCCDRRARAVGRVCTHGVG
jgi:hypothetical protein